MSKLNLESDQLQEAHNLALMIQIAAAGIATSFILILIPNVETISFTSFFLGYSFRKKFALSTTLLMVVVWEILATMVLSTSGIIFFFKLVAWILITLLGVVAHKLKTHSMAEFAFFGMLSALIFDLLVTIPYAIINSSELDNFLSIFFSSIVVGIYFTIFHVFGNGLLFSLIPKFYKNIYNLLSQKFSGLTRSKPIQLGEQISRKKKYLSASGIILIIILITALFVSNSHNPVIIVEEIEVRLDISYAGLQSNQSFIIQSFSNTSVFEILNTTVFVNYDIYDIYGQAIFVTGIERVLQNENITGYHWIYYVNDLKANIASNDYFLKNGDKILWNYESENPL